MNHGLKFTLIFVALSTIFFGITKYYLDFNSWYSSWILSGMFVVFNCLGYYERHLEDETN